MPISKKLRFEVFKRDGFACQYCGKAPPEVTLEIDHINPKSKKGTDDINNLLTACFNCNRGKSNIPLDKAPGILRENLEILKEKELQLNEYNKFIAKIERRIRKDMNEIDEIYNSHFEDWRLSERFKGISLKRFLKHLPKSTIKDAMNLACTNIENKDEAIRYFCGICWNKIRGDE